MIYHIHQSNVAFMNEKYLSKSFYKSPMIKNIRISVRQIGNEKFRQQRKILCRKGK